VILNRNILFGLCVVTTLSTAPLSQARETDANAQSYTPDYFTQFHPQNANDMVRQIPGFNVQGGGNNNRGLGQASINILINGKRPSSKSSGANQILERIPADKVIRIDIKDGASFDIPGLTGQVADIITGGSAFSGNWEYNAQFEEGSQPQLLRGEVSVAGEIGKLSYVANFQSRQFYATEDGIETFANGNNIIFEDRLEDIILQNTRPTGNINLSYTIDNERVATLNGSLSYANRNNSFRESFLAVGPGGNSGQSQTESGEDELEYEIGGDYAMPVLDGSLKLIALHSFENSINRDTFDERLLPSTSNFSIFDRNTDEGEYIGRAEYSFQSSPKHDWQVSAEGAFNFLDRTTALTENGVPTESDRTRVEEKRAEGNLTHSWTITPTLNIQTSFGTEYSELQVTTANAPARKFVRPKGFIAASFTQSPTYTWRARLERDVGQLDFGTFVSGVDLTEDIETSGNADIIPTQFWNAEVELERQDSDVISGTIRSFIRFIEDPIDRVLFADGTEGPGNLDSALEYGIEANATWLMKSIGLPGMRLELEGSLAESEIDDPITNIRRRVNDTELWSWEVNWRWDIPETAYAMGVNFEHDRESIFFRLDQTFAGRLDKPSTFAFIEHKDLLGLQVRLFTQNILDNNIVRPREIFEGDRSGPLIERQFFSRSRGRRIGFRISDTF